MIAGHLQIKNDNYYMVLNYTDANGKRRQPWIPTGLPAKGNKRRAEKLLLDTRKSFVPPVVSKENEDISSDMLFADYMELWLEIIRKDHLFLLHADGKEEDRAVFPKHRADAGRNSSQAHSELLSA